MIRLVFLRTVAQLTAEHSKVTNTHDRTRGRLDHLRVNQTASLSVRFDPRVRNPEPLARPRLGSTEISIQLLVWSSTKSLCKRVH
jgi:hypothetical protein